MFAKAIGVHRQSINRILQGDGEATISMLESVIEIFHVNPNYLMTGEGEMFRESENEIEPTIAYVPYKAFAGYSHQFQEDAFLGQLQYFSLPDSRFKDGTFRCFEINGDSMLPTFLSGDKVVCSLVYNVYYEQLIKSNHHYVVVTNEDVLLKRVVNDIKENKSIQLVSDNDTFPPLNCSIDQIKEVWKVEMRLTQDFKLR
ncbi:MAG: LexA family transcriptional regulator [Saprospiraceae bacterium]|nr:LexA family transcriptional regulator [Saprospiraceae bacterium]